MILTVEVPGGHVLETHLDGSAYDCSRAVRFDGTDSLAFGLPASHQEAIEGEGYVLDTKRGGSVNCRQVTFTAHGNGTHTECVGHIVDDDVTLLPALPRRPLLCALVSVEPVRLQDSGESYAGPGEGDDLVVTAAGIRAAIDDAGLSLDGAEAVALRVAGTTHRNPQRFSGTNPAYLTSEAARLLSDAGVDHLVVDLPSIDREQSGAGCPSHALFFGLEVGQRALSDVIHRRTLTELAFFGTWSVDGWWLLDLHVAPLASDAAPSRPMLYPLLPVGRAVSPGILT